MGISYQFGWIESAFPEYRLPNRIMKMNYTL